MVAGAFVAYALLAVVRHQTFRSTGFDLGLFEQVVWHYAHLETPASSLKGFGSIFEDHFSPVMALLAPLHRVWPRPEALLVAQAALVSVSAVPVYAFAEPRLGLRGARCLAGAYLLFGGVQEAVWFDVHEVMFAPVLIGLAVLAADRERWAWSVAAVASLLLVKEDLAFLVIAFGAWYWLIGQRRLGAAVALGGALAFPLITQVVMPEFAYWSHDRPGADLFDPAKVKTTAYLLGAFLFLPLRSRLVVLAVPLLAERMLSSNEQYWTLEGHYSLTIAPVLALAAADAARSWRPPAIMLAIAVVLIPAFPLRELVRSGAYRVDPAYAGAREVLATIPDEAPVAASNKLVPHLARRDEIVLLDRSAEVRVAAPGDTSPEGLFPFRTRAELCAAITPCTDRVAIVEPRP
jgi:uncharacterized membrane protein